VDYIKRKRNKNEEQGRTNKNKNEHKKVRQDRFQAPNKEHLYSSMAIKALDYISLAT